MSTVNVRHIKQSLEKEFRPLVDMSDYAGKAVELESDAFLSRAQSAFSMMIVAKASAAFAAASIVDTYNDNGIDAIFFDPDEKILFIVQSKWHKNGKGSIELGDILKFVKGVRDLLNADFNRFNEKVKKKEPEILAALDDPSVRFKLVLVHTGVQSLSKQGMAPLHDLLADMNDTSSMLSLVCLTQTELHKAVVAEAQGDSIKIELLLNEWGHCKQPYSSYYGQVEAADIGVWWSHHQQALFGKNLRNFTGSTDVNESIKETLLSDPAKFWYFNNGITILCNKLRKKPMGGNKRTSGAFVCEGVSIVNGAQTVGCIGSVAATNPEALVNARVNVRLISLANCPEEFSTDLTRAANTQNRIERKDFAALDPEQERLRRDLKLDLTKDYCYKSGDVPKNPSDGCTIEEATIALACANRDVSLAVQAKREVGKLWEDVTRPPYKFLFNGGLSGMRMWRLVEVYREVEQALKKDQANRQGRERMILVHGNRLILHHVFRLTDLASFDDAALDTGPILAAIPALTERCAEKVIEQVQNLYPSAYANSLFKNAAKCGHISTQCLP